MECKIKNWLVREHHAQTGRRRQKNRGGQNRLQGKGETKDWLVG